jgi:hypothetical protein
MPQPHHDRTDISAMRYLKLAVGVLLVIGGVILTFGGGYGLVFYFTTCFGAPAGSLDALYCHYNSVLPVTTAWLAIGLLFDAAAVFTLRFRDRRWLPARA